MESPKLKITLLEDVERLTAKKKIDIALTDPPYGINIAKGGSYFNSTVTGYKEVLGANARKGDVLELLERFGEQEDFIVNPLGDWTGGLNVDCGATNRKLGSDMGDAVTGGGLHGKDLSKADVSVNIMAHLLAEEKGEPVELSCAIGDEAVGGIPYEEIVEIARKYIQFVGGFEKFAEWGLIRND